VSESKPSGLIPVQLNQKTKFFTPEQYWKAISAFLSQRPPTHLPPIEIERWFFLTALKQDRCMHYFSDEWLLNDFINKKL
jgi:hypothetical protein